MVGTLQLRSPECVSEVPSMGEREVANLGSDGVVDGVQASNGH